MCRFDESRERALGINGFVDELVVALVNTGIYWPEHPRVEAAIQELQRLHGEVLAQAEHNTLVLGVVDEYLVYEARPLVGASLSAPRILRPLSARKSGGIEFEGDVSDRDFKALLEVLSKKPEPDEDYRITNQKLASMGCDRISLLPTFHASRKGVGVEGTGHEGGSTISEDTVVKLPVRLYQGVVDCLQSATINVCQGGKIDFQEVQTVVEKMAGIVSTDASSIMQASRYERYDAFTFNHSIRVCTLALHFARTLTENQGSLTRVGMAALLHDVGKSKVPFDVLHHQGRLSDDQRREMEKHPAYGAEILLDHAGVDEVAVASALDHHQTLEGGGYPKMGHGVKLSTVTKIVKICDVYEALTAVRPYKSAMSPTRSFRIMFTMRGHFDHDILRRFVEVNGVYPAGSRVQLSNGMQARVNSQSKDLKAPVVVLLDSREGGELHEEDRHLLDLSRQDTDNPVTIQGILTEDLLEASSL